MSSRYALPDTMPQRASRSGSQPTSPQPISFPAPSDLAKTDPIIEASRPGTVAGLRVKYPFPLVSCLPTSRAWEGQPRSHLTFYVSSGLSWLVAAAAALAASIVVGRVAGDAVAALRLAILCVHALTLR
jgi:hypothetical protein